MPPVVTVEMADVPIKDFIPSDTEEATGRPILVSIIASTSETYFFPDPIEGEFVSSVNTPAHTLSPALYGFYALLFHDLKQTDTIRRRRIYVTKLDKTFWADECEWEFAP